MNVKEKTKAGQRAKRGTQLALGGPHPPQPHPRRKAKFPLHTPTSTTHQGSLELQEGAKHASCPPCTSVLVHSYSDLRSREDQRS